VDGERRMATERLDVRFTGHVQGVGFRFQTHSLARRRPVTGFVRNLPDGSVRLVVEGEAGEVSGLVADVQRALDGYIQETLVDRQPASGEFTGFEIRH
jgi:acylphosphatase